MLKPQSARNRARRWCRTHRSAIDELDARRELEVRAGRAAGIAVLAGALDEGVDLGGGQVVVDEVGDVVRDHGAPVRARLCVVVVVARVWAETLPAEVVAAALACGMSVFYDTGSAMGT
jgi:hypothetical protein